MHQVSRLVVYHYKKSGIKRVRTCVLYVYAVGALAIFLFSEKKRLPDIALDAHAVHMDTCTGQFGHC